MFGTSTRCGVFWNAKLQQVVLAVAPTPDIPSVRHVTRSPGCRKNKRVRHICHVKSVTSPCSNPAHISRTPCQLHNQRLHVCLLYRVSRHLGQVHAPDPVSRRCNRAWYAKSLAHSRLPKRTPCYFAPFLHQNRTWCSHGTTLAYQYPAPRPAAPLSRASAQTQAGSGCQGWSSSV